MALGGSGPLDSHEGSNFASVGNFRIMECIRILLTECTMVSNNANVWIFGGICPSKSIVWVGNIMTPVELD